MWQDGPEQMPRRQGAERSKEEDRQWQIHSKLRHRQRHP